MDPSIYIVPFIMLVPISAIVGGYWQKVIKMTQQHREEMARIQSTQHTTLDANSTSALNALRQELAALRDTTTQYDLSVERNMHEIVQRLQVVEAKTQHHSTEAAHEPVPVRTEYIPDVRSQQPEETPIRLRAGS